jgi:hypothetical protein
MQTQLAALIEKKKKLSLKASSTDNELILKELDIKIDTLENSLANATIVSEEISTRNNLTPFTIMGIKADIPLVTSFITSFCVYVYTLLKTVYAPDSV